MKVINVLNALPDNVGPASGGSIPKEQFKPEFIEAASIYKRNVAFGEVFDTHNAPEPDSVFRSAISAARHRTSNDAIGVASVQALSDPENYPRILADFFVRSNIPLVRCDVVYIAAITDHDLYIKCLKESADGEQPSEETMVAINECFAGYQTFLYLGNLRFLCITEILEDGEDEYVGKVMPHYEEMVTGYFESMHEKMNDPFHQAVGEAVLEDAGLKEELKDNVVGILADLVGKGDD